MIRLFAALRPPPAVRNTLLARMSGVPGARWQDDDQLHLTLRYIGEVDERVAGDVATALASVAGAAPTVRLAGVGRFEKRGRTDALWAGVAPHDALAALHRKMPHITLARLSRGVGAEAEIDAWIVANAALASDAFAMTHIVLYESTLRREGASYEALARWPLA
jgi:RNA 2',3'-cyclic 3'-phosphodiesterase